MMIIYALILILLKIKDFVFQLMSDVDCLKRGLEIIVLLHLKVERSSLMKLEESWMKRIQISFSNLPCSLFNFIWRKVKFYQVRKKTKKNGLKLFLDLLTYSEAHEQNCMR